MWPSVPPTIPDAAEDEHVDDTASTLPKTITLSRPVSGEPDVQFSVSPAAMAAGLLAAEMQLGNDVSGFQVRINGEHEGSALVTLVPASWDRNQLRAEPVVPCCLGTDDFLNTSVHPMHPNPSQ